MKTLSGPGFLSCAQLSQRLWDVILPLQVGRMPHVYVRGIAIRCFEGIQMS